MATQPFSFPLVAVDVGNSRVKLGLFDAGSESSKFPEPALTENVLPELDSPTLASWFDNQSPRSWLIASVVRGTTARLVERLGERKSQVHVLQAADLPLS